MTIFDYVLQVVSLLGGLALFLFGMDVMGKSLERTAGGKLQTILAKMSDTVFKGFLLGAAVTAVIQSSSATTVMVVGFVNSGIMTLAQSVGVILGSNLGTTITGWIMSLSSLQGENFLIQVFKPDTLAPLLGTVGIVLFMFTGSEKKKSIGTIFLGFMALMTGMDLMSSSMAFLKEEAWFANMMVSFSNPILGMLVGMLLTALVQSSSACMGILISLCATGAITMSNAIPIILGQSIGTCITAMIGAMGANRNARRAACVHLIFNIISSVVFAIVFYAIDAFRPWPFMSIVCQGWHLALFQSGYKLLAIVVAMPLHKGLEKLAYVFIPKQKDPQKMELLDERLLATPAVAVQQSHQVAAQMAADAAEAMGLACGLLKQYDGKVMEKIRLLEEKTDSYQDALGTYLVKLSEKNLSVSDNRVLNTLLYTIADVERIGDHAVSVAKAAQEMEDKQIKFSAQACGELEVLQRALQDILGRTVSAYKDFDYQMAIRIEPQEQVVDSLVREVKSRHVRRLRDGLCTVEYGFVLEDLLTAFERTADHCSNVAVEILQVSQGKLEAHEYLTALKAGELEESAAFAERFAQYKARYTFPEDKE